QLPEAGLGRRAGGPAGREADTPGPARDPRRPPTRTPVRTARARGGAGRRDGSDERAVKSRCVSVPGPAPSDGGDGGRNGDLLPSARTSSSRTRTTTSSVPTGVNGLFHLYA